MIKLIFNGYYKSGSTRMWWIMKRSNSKMLHIYEPLLPEWLEQKNDRVSYLHRLPIWEDYHRPEFKRIENEWIKHFKDLKNKYEWDVLPRDVEEVAPLFDLLHNLEVPVVIQPNRCHLILDSLASRYNCKFVHIIRNPIDTWIAHTIEPTYDHPSFSNIIKKYIKKVIFSMRTNAIGRDIIINKMAKRHTIGKSYYLDSVYKLISSYFGYYKADDYLDKMLIVWSYTNYEAWKQAKKGKGMIVYYEEIVRNPEIWFEKMERFTGIKFNKNYAKELSPKFITISYRLKEDIIERLERLGLLGITEKFYPPERWFGYGN